VIFDGNRSGDRIEVLFDVMAVGIALQETIIAIVGRIRHMVKAGSFNRAWW